MFTVNIPVSIWSGIIPEFHNFPNPSISKMEMLFRNNGNPMLNSKYDSCLFLTMLTEQKSVSSQEPQTGQLQVNKNSKVAKENLKKFLIKSFFLEI